MPALPAGAEMLHQGHCPSPGVLDTPLVPPVTSAGPYRAPRWSEPSGIAQRGGCLNVSSEQNPQFSIVVVQLLSRVRLSATPWTAARQASLGFTISRSLLRLMSIELVMPSNHLTLCCPFLLLPSVFPSIRVFSRVYACHSTQIPK